MMSDAEMIADGLYEVAKAIEKLATQTGLNGNYYEDMGETGGRLIARAIEEFGNKLVTTLEQEGGVE